MSKVTEVVEELAAPIIAELGLELVEVEYLKEGKNWFVRVYIDKDHGVDIEECGLVSERLSEKLDEVDPIPHNYFLRGFFSRGRTALKKGKRF